MKVGLIVDGDSVPEYVRDLVRWAHTQDQVSITHLIVQRRPGRTGGTGQGSFGKLIKMTGEKGVRKTLQTILWSLIVKLESVRLRRLRKYNDFLRTHSLKEFNLATIAVDIQVSKSGFVYRYPQSALDEIGAAGIDVLIRCGSGILRGGILDCCRHGVLSFHHGDNRVNRGAPSAFWEVYNQEATTGFVIQRLTDELDGGEVLLAGNIPTKTFYYLNQAALYRKASAFLQRLLHRLAVEGKMPAARENSPYYSRLYKDPTVRQLMGYLWNAYMRRALRSSARRIMGRKLRWGIAYLSCADWTKAVLHKAKRIRNPEGAFLADPFVVSFKGEEAVFAEEFCESLGRAHISVFKYDGSDFTFAGKAVEESFHLSFPFIFEFDGRLFMCPESSENRDIRLYECTDYPCGWKLHSIPFNNVSAVDTVIFERAGSWWLFSNIDSADMGDRSELHIYRAENPISGTWESHRDNPVIFDSRHSRNAGLLCKDDRIYRVSQGHGFGTYGTGMSIQEIIELSIDRYTERPYAVIEPGFFGRLAGAHTFGAAKNWVVFDFLTDDH